MDESNEMMKWIKDLFPVNRSLTGRGVDFTLNYFKKINPEFSVINFKSGKKVFDWIIPKVWIINDAYLKHESGKKYAEFKKNNLHLVGYSSAVNKVMPKNEKFLYFQIFFFYAEYQLLKFYILCVPLSHCIPKKNPQA